MTKQERKNMIEQLIKLRVFSNKETLFVNISSQIKDFVFSCKVNNLDETLEELLYQPIFICTNIYINEDKLIRDSLFKKVFDDGKTFFVTLANGEVITHPRQECDFDYFELTQDEMKELILKKVEEF